MRRFDLRVHDTHLCVYVCTQPNKTFHQRNVTVDGRQVETVVSWRQRGKVTSQTQFQITQTKDARRSFSGRRLDSTLTTVVVGRQDRGEAALAVLGDDPKAGEGAPFAGDVQGRVAAVVDQKRVGAGLQEPVQQLGLVGDHRQVEGRLEEEGHIYYC